MPVTLINPDGLPDAGIYQQVAVASGTRLVFIAGQVALSADGTKVGEGNLAAQVEQCYRNIGTALAAAGATFDDVVKLTVYLVDWTPDKMEPFMQGAARAFEAMGIPAATPPLTGIGVDALAEPDLLVEIEATAVID
ncbi:RidA family protein [Mycobacterium sp. NBC_00419]|uniref:RidA family protein n=1 Tax=Mycobacterium sp. NBC_00419 TaxID=2975989 RepID=UPI002E1FEBDD